VEAFASAEEFLASGRVVETACLILDLRMPGMNGLQLQRRLAEGSKPVPIIFLSAYSLPDEERQALQAGAVHFLQKPVVELYLNRRNTAFTALKSVLTQFWCSFDTCGTLAGIDDKSVISRNPLLRSEQGDASPDVQDRPGLGHGG